MNYNFMPLQPYIYHLAEAVNWPSIEQRGLLSTTALLDLAGIRGTERERIERQHRSACVRLPNGILVRDQKPMPPKALERCLIGMTPEEWYVLLNSKVFFWLDIERLNRQRLACGLQPQVVMVIDTARLLAKHAERVALTPINTGNARRQPAARGRQTFVPYSTFIESGWATEAELLGTRQRPKGHEPVELTVTHAVSDVMNYVVRVKRLEPGEILLSSDVVVEPK